MAAAKAVKAPVLGTQRKADLPGAVFGEDFHESLVHDAVRADLAARPPRAPGARNRPGVWVYGAQAGRAGGRGRAAAGPRRR